MRLAIRFAAVMLALASVVLVGFAVLVPGSGAAGSPTRVADPASVALPDLGLFGGSAVVYGRADSSGVSAAELGCRLLDDSGREQSTARMSHLAATTLSAVEVQGQQLQPLFTVRSYPSGSRLECNSARSVEPMAVGTPSTFGGNAGLVRATAGVGALACAALALLGFVATRRRA